MKFEFSAIDEKDNIVKGTVEDKDRDAIALLLKNRGLRPYYIESVSKRDKSRGHLSLRQQLLLVSQLSQMVSIGLDIHHALHIIRLNQNRNSKIYHSLEQCEAYLIKGNSISDSFMKSKLLESHYVYWVAMGEKIGNLKLSLATVETLLRQRYQAREEIKKAAIYPLFIILMAMVATRFISRYIFPVFTEMIGDIPLSLWPWPTRMMLYIDRHALGIVLFLVAITASIIIFYKYSIEANWGADFHQYLWRIIGGASRKKQKFELRLLKILELMSENGIPIQQSLSHIEERERNPFVVREMHLLNQRIDRGANISRAMLECLLFTNFFKEFMLEGESAGVLLESAKQLLLIREVEEKSARDKRLKLIEPILIIMVSLFVGFIIIATLLPLLEMSQYLL